MACCWEGEQFLIRSMATWTAFPVFLLLLFFPVSVRLSKSHFINRNTNAARKQKWKKLNDNKQRHAYPFLRFCAEWSHSFHYSSAFQNSVNTYSSHSRSQLAYYFIFIVVFIYVFAHTRNFTRGVTLFVSICCLLRSTPFNTNEEAVRTNQGNGN